MESNTNPIKPQIYTLENSLLRTRDQIVMKADLENGKLVSWEQILMWS